MTLLTDCFLPCDFLALARSMHSYCDVQGCNEGTSPFIILSFLVHKFIPFPLFTYISIHFNPFPYIFIDLWKSMKPVSNNSFWLYFGRVSMITTRTKKQRQPETESIGCTRRAFCLRCVRYYLCDSVYLVPCVVFRLPSSTNTSSWPSTSSCCVFSSQCGLRQQDRAHPTSLGVSLRTPARRSPAAGKSRRAKRSRQGRQHPAAQGSKQRKSALVSRAGEAGCGHRR